MFVFTVMIMVATMAIATSSSLCDEVSERTSYGGKNLENTTLLCKEVIFMAKKKQIQLRLPIWKVGKLK